MKEKFMNQSQIIFNTELKTQIVLELLNEKPKIRDIAEKYETTTRNILIWKQQFLENAALIFETKRSTQSLKNKLEKCARENEKLVAKVDKAMLERDRAFFKLQSLSIPSSKKFMSIHSNTLTIKKRYEMNTMNYLLIS